ncbi:MAG: T9SS C-terminal target domain-containing protein [Calditrichaeota bacterium]|nr:MAG: T9SS C-terminal target domain-containing protein [Calditrichota bacterium]
MTTQSSYGAQRDAVLAQFRYALLFGLTQKDSVAFMISDFTAQFLDQAFVPFSDSLIDERIETTKNTVPILNTLPFMLRKAVAFFNERHLGGEIWVLSDDSDHGGPPGTAMDIVRQTLKSAEKPVVFRISDAGGRNYHRIGNKSYSGNEYLYENLSRLSHGTMTSLWRLPRYNWMDAMLDCFAPMVSAVELDPIPEGGLSFSRFDLNRGRKNFNITSRYFQIGQYEGETPFLVRYFGLLNQKFYNKNLTIAANPYPIPPEFVSVAKRYWFTVYLRSDLLQQPQSHATIRYIEKLSLENYILTPYDGFIVPGPDGSIAFRKLVAEDSVVVDTLQTADPEVSLPAEFALRAAPNPFNPKTVLYIDWPLDAEITKVELRIFSLLGQQVRSFTVENPQRSGQVRIVWDGRDNHGGMLPSGIYLVSLVTPSLSKSIKVTLLK